MKRWVVPVSFVLFLALCASATAWVMQWLKPAPRPVAAAPVAQSAAVVPLQAAAALFGARKTSAPTSGYVLFGVVIARTPGESVAIVGVEGKPPEAVRAGGEVVAGVTVKEVHPDFVVLSENGRERRVELPEKTSPATAAAAPAAAVPTVAAANVAAPGVAAPTAAAAPAAALTAPPPTAAAPTAAAAPPPGPTAAPQGRGRRRGSSEAD